MNAKVNCTLLFFIASQLITPPSRERSIMYKIVFVQNHTLRDPARLPAQLAGRCEHRNWNSDWRGKNYFVLGRLEQKRLNKNLLYWRDKPKETNQERTPFKCALWDPNHLSFNSQRGPPFSRLSLVTLAVLDQPSSLIALSLRFIVVWFCFCGFYFMIMLGLAILLVKSTRILTF